MAKQEKKFPSEVGVASGVEVKGSTPLLVAVDGAIKQLPLDEVKNHIEITGESLDPIASGALPTPPAGQRRTMDVVGGVSGATWTHASLPGGSASLTSGQLGVLFWNGSTWALTNVVDLPVAQPNGQVAKGDSNAVSGGEVAEKTALKLHGKNYVDYTGLKDGFYINEDTGELVVNPSYKATENFIKIEPNTTYKINKVVRWAYYSTPNIAGFIEGHVEDIYSPTDKTTPANANYIRLSGSSSWSEMYLGLASEYTGFVPYEKVLEQGVKAQAITDELKDEILSTTAKIVRATGKNRINPETLVADKYVNAFTGLLEDNANYNATDFIYVGDLAKYTISPLIRHIARYSSADASSYITGQEYPVSNTVTRGSENYVRLSFLKSDSGLQLESGDTATAYEPFSEVYKIESDTATVELPTVSKLKNEVIIPAPNTIHILPANQYNLYFKNAFISDFGFDSVEVVDAFSNSGQFMSKKFRLSLGSFEEVNLILKGYKDGYLVSEKTILFKAASGGSGSGQTRKVLFLGDSTINQEVIVDHFKTYFDADVMSVSLQGTRTTSSGNKHEGRSGWTIDDYYQKDVVGGISNPFFNSSTSRFDFAYYLSQTGQTMGANDWFIVQLGINDLYPISISRDLEDAKTRVEAMLTKLNYIIASVKAVNANIRVGISMTIPPASEQDATAILLASSGAIFSKDAYEKIGLKTWWYELLKEFEPRVSERIYLVPSNLFLDTENNFKTSDLPIDNYNTTLVKTQNDDVHPSANGYKQMADIYIGIVKYFG